MINTNIYPELKDIFQAICKYNATHKDGCFVFNFVGWKKDLNNKCPDCGDYCDEYDENKSLMGAYGDLETLRLMLQELRDNVEDNTDGTGFVSI